MMNKFEQIRKKEKELEELVFSKEDRAFVWGDQWTKRQLATMMKNYHQKTPNATPLAFNRIRALTHG